MNKKHGAPSTLPKENPPAGSTAGGQDSKTITLYSNTPSDIIQAKNAIIARCDSCYGIDCTHSDCALHETVVKGKYTSAIKKYCKWCMHGNPIDLCSSLLCPIYQYRAQGGKQ